MAAPVKLLKRERERREKNKYDTCRRGESIESSDNFGIQKYWINLKI